MTTPALVLDSIDVTFGDGLATGIRALSGVSLTVERGEFVIVVGSNGAGKTTLANVVAGVCPAGRGSIRLSGVDVTGWPVHKRGRRIGRVFQDPLAGTAGALTVHDNLALAERRSRRRRLRVPRTADRHRELLSTVGMGLERRLDTRVDALSGGQRQALAVLMAVQSEPELLILDEHVAALDPVAAERVLQLTTALANDHGIATLMITHNMTHAVELGTRTVMMNRGTVLFDVDTRTRAGLTVDGLIHRFRQLAADDLSDRTSLG